MAYSRKKKRGATLTELIVATFISVLVLAACLAILFTGSASWARGLGHIGADTDAQIAVRTMAKQLQEAMSVTVDSNGMGVTYQVGQTDGNGNYILPLTWDGVLRRFQVQGSQLMMVEGNQTRVIANGIILTDPLSGAASKPYLPFTAGVSVPTNQVTLEVATQWYGYTNHVVSSRQRETVFIRNTDPITN